GLHRTETSSTQEGSCGTRDGRPEQHPARRDSHFARCIEYNSSTEHYPNRADGTLGANVVRVLETTKKSLEEARTSQVEIPRGQPIPASEPMPGLHAEPPSMGSL